MARLKSVALAEITVTSPFLSTVDTDICTTSGAKFPEQSKFSPLNGARLTMTAADIVAMAALIAAGIYPYQ